MLGLGAGRRATDYMAGFRGRDAVRVASRVGAAADRCGAAAVRIDQAVRGGPKRAGGNVLSRADARGLLNRKV